MFSTHKRACTFLLALCLLTLCNSLAAATDISSTRISGNIALELNAYADEGQFTHQDYHYNTSLAVKPEFYWQWNDSNDSIIFTPFIRIDQQDDQRTHGDIRELAWTHVNGNWEIHTGIRKVFWGVTEFNHLVDIVNQTDNVDAFDGEEKLGQAMINLSRVTDWGIFDAFILAGFRERTFAGEDGRLRAGLIVDTDNALYESSKEERHIDYALRWSHSLNVFDWGLYWFDGTDREPILNPPLINGNTINGNTQLTPYYEQITQVGIDVQATIDSWLWKLESLYQNSNSDNYFASQTGFEYTFYGVRQSTADLGILLEYGWDERGKAASSIAQNDLYLGTRLTLNDTGDSAVLLGASYDMDYHTRSVLVEASRRLTDRWTLSIEGILFKASDNRTNNSPINSNGDPAAALDQDDRIQITAEHFF